MEFEIVNKEDGFIFWKNWFNLVTETILNQGEIIIKICKVKYCIVKCILKNLLIKLFSPFSFLSPLWMQDKNINRCVPVH